MTDPVMSCSTFFMMFMFIIVFLAFLFPIIMAAATAIRDVRRWMCQYGMGV